MKTYNELLEQKSNHIRKLERKMYAMETAFVVLLLLSVLALILEVAFSPFGDDTAVVILIGAAMVAGITGTCVTLEIFEKKIRKYAKSFDDRCDMRYYAALREAESFRSIGAARQRHGWPKDDLAYYEKMADKYERKAAEIAKEYILD